MLELAWPWLLILLPLPWLVNGLFRPHREKVSALRLPFFREMIDATGFEAREGAVILRRRKLQIICAALIWALLVLAVAKPQWVGEPIVRTEASRDVMLAIDLSGSMDYVDFDDGLGNRVQRLAAVQRVVDQFVAQLVDERVGLVVFGNRAYLQLPFTRDINTARSLVGLMTVGMAGPRTALGDAIGLSINSFQASVVDERLLILLTDGNDTASKMTPINAAGIAELNGIKIFTIGVGDPEATGEDRVDFETLEQVASRTGGQFFNAADEAALAAVYREIDEMTAGEVRTQSWRPRQSLVHWPALAAVLVGLLGYLLLGLRMRRRSAAQ